MAYPLDLRTRIVDAVDRGVGTMSEIAALFGVNESFIYKLLRQRRERGDIGPLPHGGGAQVKLNEDHLMILTDLVAQPSVPISTETLSQNSLMSRARGVFNVSKLVTIIEVRESLTHQGRSGGQRETGAPPVFRRIQAAHP